MPETVVHGETGLLVGEDTADVAVALERVLADRARARIMGLAGRRRAEQEFGPERAVAIVEEVYHTLA